MCSQSFIKRIVPFVIALALGLFVASFFVNIAPTFKFRKARYQQRKEMQKLRYENERLQSEIQRLQQKLAETEKKVLLDEPLPPLPPSVRMVDKIQVVPAPPKAR